jgi:hypothetical protein
MAKDIFFSPIVVFVLIKDFLSISIIWKLCNNCIHCVKDGFWARIWFLLLVYTWYMIKISFLEKKFISCSFCPLSRRIFPNFYAMVLFWSILFAPAILKVTSKLVKFEPGRRLHCWDFLRTDERTDTTSLIFQSSFLKGQIVLGLFRDDWNNL